MPESTAESLYCTVPYLRCVEDNNFRARDEASKLKGRPNRQTRKKTHGINFTESSDPDEANSLSGHPW